jgi:hypothetical protein
MAARMIKKFTPLLVLAITAGAVMAAVVGLRATLFYPQVSTSFPGNIRLTYLYRGHASEDACSRAAARIAATMTAKCPACEVTQRCARGLSAGEVKLFSPEPLPDASIRLREGIVVYAAPEAALGLALCTQSAEAMQAASPDSKARCYPPHTLRP